jgi:hypothetical protein
MEYLDELLIKVGKKLDELNSLRPILDDRMKAIYDKYRLELNLLGIYSPPFYGDLI